MEVTQDSLTQQAFPTLTDAQLALLAPFGEERATRVGETLFTSGQRPPLMVVTLEGRIEIIDPTDGDERFISESGPSQFAGELGLLTGQTIYATCVVREAGRVLIIPAEAVQHVVATIPALSDSLLLAFAARRQLLLRAAAASLTLIGRKHSPDVLHYEEFVHRNRIPHRWLDPADPTATALLERLGATGDARVWVVLRGQKALAGPSCSTWPRRWGSIWGSSRMARPICW